MDLYEMARQFPGMSVTIKLEDLLRAQDSLARRIREDEERERSRRRVEYGDCLIPKEEARRMLGSPNPTTLWRWEKRGYLTPVRIGVKVYYKKTEIEKIVQNGIIEQSTI